VWVTTADGRELSGTVVSSTPTSVVVRKDGLDATVALGDVRRIEAPDSLSDGIRHGAIGGAVVCGGFALAVVRGFCGSEHASCSGAVPFVMISAGVGAGVGAGLGALIDHLVVHRDTIYAATAAPMKIDWAPVVGPHHAGMGVTVRWR
jgi:hypothetical protein